jgi:hypothetical protein
MKFTPAGGRVTVNILCELQNHENRNKIISKVSIVSLWKSASVCVIPTLSDVMS